MNEIIVEHIIKKENVLQVDFSYNKGLEKYFSGTSFVVEYPESIAHVPDAVAIIPFICNVLPIVWLTDSKLYVKEIDSDFYNCIDEIKQGYKNMYCDVDFKGEIISTKTVLCRIGISNRKTMFYSGGLDSLHTLINHFEENVDLVSIWGSDIEFSNEIGWKKAYQIVEKTAKNFNLKSIVIRSNFREFDREIELDKEFKKQLQDSWWHGVKHGIGLLGHVALYVYLNNISTVYIASSNCASDGAVKCASDPTIDNYVKFCGCNVVHDGYQFNRQQKVKSIVEFCRTQNRKVDIHVCWQSQTGENCCKCEKCYRTISALIAEMADPKDYGFNNANKTVPSMKNNVLSGTKINQYIATTQWKPIRKRIIENKKSLRKSIWWDSVKWIEKTNFNDIEKAKLITKRHMKVMHFFNKKIQNLRSILTR